MAVHCHNYTVLIWDLMCTVLLWYAPHPCSTIRARSVTVVGRHKLLYLDISIANTNFVIPNRHCCSAQHLFHLSHITPCHFQSLHFIPAVIDICWLLYISLCARAHVCFWQQREYWHGNHIDIKKHIGQHIRTSRLDPIRSNSSSGCTIFYSTNSWKAQESQLEACSWRWDSGGVPETAAGSRQQVRHWLEASHLDCLCYCPSG